MNTHYLKRILDFASDARMPQNLIATMLKTRNLRDVMNRAHLHKTRQLFLVLTCDVEREYGSRRVKGGGATVSPFLRNAQEVLLNTSIFIEGSLVEENSDILHTLERQGIEIGLHGYRHELWGPPQWYLSDKPLTLEEKNSLLEAAIEAFRSSGLRRPLIFRSPNLAADKSTMRLLVAKGFQVDSSLPSHKGVLPVPQLFGGPEGLIRIPVTAEPTPSLSRRRFFPYYGYRVCNLKSLKEMGNELLQYVSRIVALQEALGFLPHLVILSHSWEFLNPSIEHQDYGYCSPANFEFLHNLVRILSENFDVKRVSIGSLAELSKEKITSSIRSSID